MAKKSKTKKMLKRAKVAAPSPLVIGLIGAAATALLLGRDRIVSAAGRMSAHPAE